MARKLSVEYPGAIYHLMNRGKCGWRRNIESTVAEGSSVFERRYAKLELVSGLRADFGPHFWAATES